MSPRLVPVPGGDSLLAARDRPAAESPGKELKAPALGNLSFSDWPLLRNKEMPQGLGQTPSERPGLQTTVVRLAGEQLGRAGRERNYDSYQRGLP